MTIGERLIEIRGKTPRDEFAAQIGIHPQTLYTYEKGKRAVPLRTAEKICSAYGVSVEWLMTGNGAMRPENEDLMEAGPITEQKHSMHLTLTKKGEEKLMEIYGKLVESQEREIEALKEQVASLKAENAELKARLSLSPTAPGVTPQANTA